MLQQNTHHEAKNPICVNVISGKRVSLPKQTNVNRRLVKSAKRLLAKGAEMRFWGTETDAVLGQEIYEPYLPYPICSFSLRCIALVFAICNSSAAPFCHTALPGHHHHHQHHHQQQYHNHHHHHPHHHHRHHHLLAIYNSSLTPYCPAPALGFKKVGLHLLNKGGFNLISELLNFIRRTKKSRMATSWCPYFCNAMWDGNSKPMCFMHSFFLCL